MGGGASKAPPAASKAYVAKGPPADWFYAVGDQRQGPVTAVRLHELHYEGMVPTNALVWCPRLTQWQQYKDAQTVLTRELSPEDGSGAPASAGAAAGPPPELVRRAFENYDHDKSGTLDYKELRAALAHYGVKTSDAASAESEHRWT